MKLDSSIHFDRANNAVYCRFQFSGELEPEKRAEYRDALVEAFSLILGLNLPDKGGFELIKGAEDMAPSQILNEIVNHPIIQKVARFPREIFLVIILAPDGIVIPKQGYIGTATSVNPHHIDEVVELCQQHNAKSFILLHNHPNQVRAKDFIIYPSENDIYFTTNYQLLA